MAIWRMTSAFNASTLQSRIRHLIQLFVLANPPSPEKNKKNKDPRHAYRQEALLGCTCFRFSILGIRGMSSNLASIHLSISWFNSLLYMLEVTLAFYYYSRFTIARSFKILLASVLIADAVSMIANYASAWILLINPQDFLPRDALWTVPVSTFMISILAAIEEFFLIDRCRKLSQPIIITAALCGMVVAHVILSLYSGLFVVTHPDLDPNFARFGNKAAAISASLAATVDMFIPLALTWQLYKVTPAQIRRQRSLLDTIVNGISSGGVGGLASFVLLVLFWTRVEVFWVFANSMGRIYALTLLVNLIVSKRRHSSHHPATEMVPTKKRESVTTQVSLVTFSLSRSASTYTSDREKQLPPTPGPEEV
ncbi:unnamed protein product [Cyclocybe aegerita]|uniref:Uncharacterized protein n=1 Tax=Cyclocybe aegerita TaxID=1973307 RepID=A0A8S0VRP8_CYCAE|nr:unnamed protein product [Cyclocybe aegerita]